MQLVISIHIEMSGLSFSKKEKKEMSGLYFATTPTYK